MRSTRKPRSSLERFLVLVLVGFITIDLLLVVPAYASELRLDRLHPSLPIVNLRPLAAGRARLADGLGEEFTEPVRVLAGELKQAGARTFNAVLHEVNSASGNLPQFTEAPTNQIDQGSGEAAFPLMPSESPGSIETAVVQTATSLAFSTQTKNPTSTNDELPSYTPSSTATPSEQSPTVTPTKTAIFTATLVCVTLTTSGCESAPEPAETSTAIPTATPQPTQTQAPVTVPTYPGSVPAFPGAEGWGAESIGGRGGQVIEVTNLNSGGPGSLRACAEDASGPRICVFRVAGEIVLTGSRLKIRNAFLTIAGQTAPGGGITLRAADYSVRPIIQFENGVHDVIIRYITVRPGWNSGERDAISFRGGHDIILDHVSLEWSTDEIIGINPSEGESVSKVSIQRSILAEALRPHSTGILFAGEDDLSQITLHHNLLAHNAHRNPRVGDSRKIEFINNVVYNWGSRAGTTVASAQVDFIGNYFKAGPWSDKNDIILHEMFHPAARDIIFPDPSIYAQGNLATPLQPDPDADNWNLFQYHYQQGSLPTDWRRLSPFPSTSPVGIQSAQSSYDSVLADVGNNARLSSSGDRVARQDTVDRDIINDVVQGTGPSQDNEIDHQDDFGGYPAIDSGTPYADTDHDGMADNWELRYCFNPSDSSDGPQDADGDGYTNLEEFLNGTAPAQGGSC